MTEVHEYIKRPPCQRGERPIDRPKNPKPSKTRGGMELGQKPEKPWFLDAAFVIPLLIFIAYFWALSLTAGTYTYFNVPQEFISLNPTNVLATSRPFLALIAYFLLCFLGAFFLGFMMENHTRVGLYIAALLLEVPILQFIYTAFNPKKTVMWSLGVGLTVIWMVITSWRMDLLISRYNRNRQKRLLNRVSTTQYLNYLAIFIPLGAILGGHFFFFHMGRSGARNTDTFYVIKQSVEDKKDQGVVLLGNYGDYIVGVPFNRDTKEFESFVVLKMPQSDTTRLIFTHEKVGKLQRVKEKAVEAKP